jgi:hypothetical protein
LFKNSNLKVSFKADNTIGKLLAHNKNNNFNKFKECDVYQLTCQDCTKNILDRLAFHIRFQDHFPEFKYRNGKSKFAQHLIDKRHSIAPMENIMEALHTPKKGNTVKTLERFLIHVVTKLFNQTTDNDTVKFNVILDTIIQRNS